MSKFAPAENGKAADDRESGSVVAVFPTRNGNFKYVLDTEEHTALEFSDLEDDLANYRANLM